MFDHAIAEAVEVFGVAAGDLTAGRLCRSRSVASARQAVIYLLHRKYPTRPLRDLGRAVGIGDHATVAYSIKRAPLRAATDPAYALDLFELGNRIDAFKRG